jgi:hypothetical protein
MPTASNAPAGKTTEIAEDAAEAEAESARHLVAAVLDLQLDSAAPNNSLAGEAATAVSNGAAIVAAGTTTAAAAATADCAAAGEENDSAATAEPAAAAVESSEKECAAEEDAQQDGEQQAEPHKAYDEAMIERIAAAGAAAFANAPVVATPEEAADMLQQIDSSIAPSLARYAQLLQPKRVLTSACRILLHTAECVPNPVQAITGELQACDCRICCCVLLCQVQLPATKHHTSTALQVWA